MSNKYTITGLGPVNADESFKMFTKLPAPFIARAEWLSQQPTHPEVGDVLELAADGTLMLIPEPRAVDEHKDGLDGQKKNLGSAELGASSLAEFSTYQRKPIIVHASKITDIGELTSDGYLDVQLEGGANREATPEMLARMTPVIGDYWVIAPQDGGNYEYLNPKAVFEHKYELISARHAS